MHGGPGDRRGATLQSLSGEGTRPGPARRAARAGAPALPRGPGGTGGLVHGRARRDRRVSGTERRGEDDDPQDAHGTAVSHGGARRGRGLRAVDRRAGVQAPDRARARQPPAARVGPAGRRDVSAQPRDLRYPGCRLRRPARGARRAARAGLRRGQAGAPAVARGTHEVRARRGAAAPA